MSFLGRFNNKNGFTLIELLVVIGIVSILATMVIATLDPVSQYQKSIDARKKSDLSQIQKALEAYYQDNSRYPEASASFQVMSNVETPTAIDWGQPWQPYMNILPKSPDSTTYAYYAPEGGQSYYLYASLSRGGKDPQACKTDGSACDGAQTYSISCTGVCSYGVTSANVSP